MKLIIGSIALAFVCSISSAQTNAYSFKGNTLGMSLAEFKSKNAYGPIYVNTGPPNWLGRPSAKNTKAVQLPLCTDTMRDFPGDSRDLLEGEVLCNLSPGTQNSGAKDILGDPAHEVIYRFHNGKLWFIYITFPATRFSEIAAAFREKYGATNVSKNEVFQNGYGAKWTGEALGWEQGQQKIALGEGSANGPGQRYSYSMSQIVFADLSNQPTPDTKPLDF